MPHADPSRLRLFCTITALTFLTCAALSAQRRRHQYGNVIYELPTGWKKGRTGEQSVALRSDDERYGGAIDIFRGAPAPKDVERWLKRQLRAALEEDERDDTFEWTPFKSTKEEGRAFTVGAMRRGRRLETGLAIAVGDRVEWFRFRLRVRSNKKSERVLRASMGAFMKLGLSARFVSEGEPPLLGAPQPGPLQGAYMTQNTKTGLDGSMRFVPRFLVFTTAGRFSENMPKAVGIETFDPASTLGAAPDDTGNYRIQDDELLLEFADGSVKRSSFAQTDSGLKIGKRRYRALTTPEDGTRFEGNFNALRVSGFTPGSGIQGSAVSSKSFRFAKDGSFTSGGFSSVTGSFDTGGGFVTGSGKRDALAGQYTIEAGCLKLTASEGSSSSEGGAAASLSIAMFGPRLMFLNGRRYLKRSEDKK